MCTSRTPSAPGRSRSINPCGKAFGSFGRRSLAMSRGRCPRAVRSRASARPLRASASAESGEASSDFPVGSGPRLILRAVDVSGGTDSCSSRRVATFRSERPMALPAAGSAVGRSQAPEPGLDGLPARDRWFGSDRRVRGRGCANTPAPEPVAGPRTAGSLPSRPERPVCHGPPGRKAASRSRATACLPSPVRITKAPKCASDPHVVSALRYGSKSERGLPPKPTPRGVGRRHGDRRCRTGPDTPRSGSGAWLRPFPCRWTRASVQPWGGST